METTYQIGHDALAGKTSLGGVMAAVRRHPANVPEILIAALTEVLETRPTKSGIDQALKILKAAAVKLDGGHN